MLFLYNTSIHLIGFILKIVALLNHKIRRGVEGRKQTFTKLTDIIKDNDKTIWFHCASLGEYEQGLPIIQGVKELYPEHKIILTFFSPSGYEVRKNTPVADVVCYLPLDTKKNARKFLKLVHPDLIVFVKYEFWLNYLNEIKKREIKAILISALFRKNQLFFRPQGKWMQKYLKAFSHIFVQNKSSKRLLDHIGYENATIAGDTRLDRVYNQLDIDNSLPYIETFVNGKPCFVAGSTWPEGEKLICDYINSNPTSDIKYIIAPHSINSDRIKEITLRLKVDHVLFSDMKSKNLKDVSVFLVDTIGLLSKIYSYGNLAYVGGAIGKTGLHNILEPAVFGIPIIIGKNHKKFPEAQLMIDYGGVFQVESKDEFFKLMDSFLANSKYAKKIGNLNKEFIEKNKGAVIQILHYIRN